MSTFSWVLVAVGLFLVVYAALALLGGGRKAGNRRRESLGCGFVLLAALVWGIALARYLGDWWAGIRLGAAFAFVLPALVTLAHPGRGRVVVSVVLLTFAVILGASGAPTLWARLNPPRSVATVQRVEKAIGELRQRIEDTQEHVEHLTDDRDRLKAEIRDLGHADFESISQDAKGFALLEELADLERLLADARRRLDVFQSGLERMESALRRVRRLADSESDTAEPEIAQIIEEARRGPIEGGLTTVEEHVQREQLRELFERELAQ